MKGYGNTTLGIATALLVLFALGTANAAPQEKEWLVTPLEGPGDVYWYGTFGNDVNDAGTIGGGWLDEDGGYHAAYWVGGVCHDLASEIGVPEAQEGGTSNVLSINNHGLMGGTATGAGGQVAVLWDVKHSTLTDLHPSGYVFSAVWGVNASGDAVGIAAKLVTLPNGNEIPLQQPYAWPKNGDGMPLPIGDSLGGFARGVNSSGTVSGSYFSPVGWVQAAIWEPDGDGGYTLTDLHALLDDDTIVASEAFDVHENGMVVGMAYGFDAGGIFTYAWTWKADSGFDVLDDDGQDAAIAWKAAGTYVAGSTGLLGNTPDATAAVWVKGSLELIPEHPDMPQSEAASVNKSGLVVGYSFDEDDVGLLFPQGWYAEKD